MPTFSESASCEVAFVDQPLHSQGDFDGVEVFALDVLHQGHSMQVLVVHFADIGGQGLQSGFAGGPPAAFATDNQVASVVGAFDRDGLDYAQRADRVGQLFERLFIELRARLRGVGEDRRNGDLRHFGHRFEPGIQVFAPENGVQTAS